MLNSKVKQYSIIFISLCFALIFFFVSKVDATYYGCSNKIENTELYDCGSKIYSYYEDIEHSSVVEALGSNSILYAGTIDNIEVFYVNGFRYFNVTYDDRSNKNNNIWSILTTKGKVVFDGSFKDSFIVDESHSGYYIDLLFKEVYTIRQYKNDGKLYRTIVLYNYHVGDIEFNDAKYDDLIFDGSNTVEVLDSINEFSVTTNSVYGVKNANVTINGNSVVSSLKGNTISVKSEELNKSLIKGEVNTLEVNVKDFFGKKASKKYKLLLVNNEVLIGFSTMDSVVKSASRRILINAIAGKGKSIDTDYCWYYWSESPDDGLTYEEFLKNYAASSYKGSYSEDKGVILRNTSGTYYLYALAKDKDSVTVKRSEGYVLNGGVYEVNYNIYDMIFVVSVALAGIIPIVIYLYIRKKGY